MVNVLQRAAAWCKSSVSSFLSLIDMARRHDEKQVDSDMQHRHSIRIMRHEEILAKPIYTSGISLFRSVSTYGCSYNKAAMISPRR